MKTQFLSVVATLLIALSAAAQGGIGLDDFTTQYGVAIDAAGNYYNGTYGMEVWELNATTVPAGINLAPDPGSGLTAYNAMVGAGFKREATFAGQTMSLSGAFSLDFDLTLADAPPGGASVVVALAVWNTSDPSWVAMLRSAGTSTRAGVIAFETATGAVQSDNPLAPPSLSVGWQAAGRDLVMTAVPEPGMLALASLGGAFLLLLRRRR